MVTNNDFIIRLMVFQFIKVVELQIIILSNFELTMKAMEFMAIFELLKVAIILLSILIK